MRQFEVCDTIRYCQPFKIAKMTMFYMMHRAVTMNEANKFPLKGVQPIPQLGRDTTIPGRGAVIEVW